MRTLILLLAAGGCLAQNSPPWKPIFDGKTMKGWRTPIGDGWTIEDGCLKARAKPHVREDLVSVEEFGDLELSWEWRISLGGNSGLKYGIQDFVPLTGEMEKSHKKFEDAMAEQYRTRACDLKMVAAKGGQIYVVGFEFQMIDDAGHADARRGPLYQTGSLYSMIARTQAAAKAVGEYNESRVVMKGSHIEHLLNGVKVLDGSLDEAAIAGGLEKRWGKDSPVYRYLTGRPKKACPISLQNHNDEAWFRNIKVRKAQ